MRPCLSGLDDPEHNPLDGWMALLAESAFGQCRLDGDFCGGHQFVHGAAIGHAVQLLALFIGEHTLEGQLDVERVSAFLLFSAVVGDFHGDAGEGNVFFLGIQFDGQRLARGQGGIEIVVGEGAESSPPRLLGRSVNSSWLLIFTLWRKLSWFRVLTVTGMVNLTDGQDEGHAVIEHAGTEVFRVF